MLTAAPIWNGLVETNQRLAEVFRELNRLWEEDKQEYIRQVAAATTQPVHEWPASGAVGQSLVSASEHMQVGDHQTLCHRHASDVCAGCPAEHEGDGRSVERWD